jgi:NADPH2:quinone reductase
MGSRRAVRAWQARAYGAPADVLELTEIEVGDPGPREIRVAVEAVTLNFNDLDGIYGRYKTVPIPVPYTPGMEVLGRAEACGPGAENLLGRRVVAIPTGAHGGYAEAVVAPAAMAFEMPDDMPTADAAAVYMPFHLSWFALRERGRVQVGETVLVHAAAGGVGSAALQVARNAGARVIATVGSDDKAELCRSLGADVVINYRTTDFAVAALEATDGRGVDVAFDTVGGDVTLQTFRCMAFNGRHVIAGFASGIEQEDEGIVPRPILFGNFSLCGVCHAYVDDPLATKREGGVNFPSHDDGERLHAQVLTLLRAGELRTVVDRVVAFDELPRALTDFEARQTKGRVVVRVDQ